MSKKLVAVESDSSFSHGWMRPSEEAVAAVVSVVVTGCGATKRRGKDGNRMKIGGPCP